MEKYSFLNDIPPTPELSDRDVLVIGKFTVIAGKTRFIGRTVSAADLKKDLIAGAVDDANLDYYVEQAKEHAEAAEDSAKKGDQALTKTITAKDQAEKASAEAAKIAQSLQNILDIVTVHDLSEYAALLADPKNDIYANLMGQCVATIPAGLMLQLSDHDDRIIYDPRTDVPYTISISTVISPISFVQTITFIENSDKPLEWNLTYQRAGRSFAEAKKGWSPMLGLPSGDLFIDGTIWATEDVRLIQDGSYQYESIKNIRVK